MPHARSRPRTATLPLAIAAFAVVAGCSAPPSSQLTIVVRAAPFADAVTASVADSSVHWDDADPADDAACTESYAAVELRDLLARCPGVGARTIALTAGERMPPAGDCIVIGDPRSQPLVRDLLRAVLPDAHSPDAFRLRALRRDGRTIWVIAGSTRTGALYGAYAFLERLGVRFYGPADSETVLPRKPVELPRRLDVASAPAFEVRGFWAWEPRGNAAFFRWMARRRMNLWTVAEPGVPLLRKLGIRLAGGGHSMQSDYLKPRRYFAAHPEWYGFHAGHRSPNIAGESGDNFCTSNAAAVAELAKNLAESLRSGPLRDADIVNVWPLDGGRWCECDSCAALGAPSDRVLDLARRLDDAVRAARRRGELDRDVVFSPAAYLETTAPPSHPVPIDRDHRTIVVTFFPYRRCYAHALSDPTCTELNRRIQSAWAGWSDAPDRAYAGPVGIGEYYNVSWFKTLPLVFPHVMARDIADYHAAGARLFTYMHAPTARWGPWRLNHLVLSQALWSPGFDADSLVHDYCTRAYPDANADMEAFYRALEQASANIMFVEAAIGAFGVAGASQGRLSVRTIPVLPFAHLPYVPAARGANAAPAWSEVMSAMHAARAALDRARGAALTPGERARLDDDEQRFAYGQLTFTLYDCLLSLALVDRGQTSIDVPRALAAADSAAAGLERVHDLVQVAGAHSDARDGLEASHVAPTLEYFRRRFGRR